MPIKVSADLPAKTVIEKENIFIMDENRAITQEIRPLKIAILNLMPKKHETEIQLLRVLSNTPLQVDITFLCAEHHVSKNTPESHLNQFYTTFSKIKHKKFDGLIITGAPIEQLDFEEVNYWEELTQIMDWSKTNVTSTYHICWAAQAGLYHHFGIDKILLDKKLSGVYSHKVFHRKTELIRGFDDIFLIPHSRYTGLDAESVRKHKELKILAESEIAGPAIIASEDGKQVFVMGHPEYDRNTLAEEYKRDKAKGLEIEIPINYFPDNDPENAPVLTWRSHANALYTNWLNYYVYQVTPYVLDDGEPEYMI